MNEQHELYEKARSRINQKKRLYWHFIIFVVTCFILFIINKLFNYYEAYNWYLWISILWFFFVALHFINVFITNPFLGKDWERKETERLIRLQEKKLEGLRTKVENLQSYGDADGKHPS